MGNLYLTGSMLITVGGRDVTKAYGALWPSFQYLATLGNVVLPQTAYVPFTQPPDSPTPVYPIAGVPLPTGGYEVSLGEGSSDDHSWGLKASVGARGIVSATSAAILNYGGVSADALPNWQVGFSPYPGKDLLPTWGSVLGVRSIGLPTSFYPQPVFYVISTDIGDFTDPAWVNPGGIVTVQPGNGIVLLTGQGSGHPPAPNQPSTAKQNGLWVITHPPLGAYTFTRPSDWATWLGNFNDTPLSNSAVEVYGWLDGTSAPFTVNVSATDPTVSSGVDLWILETSDGSVWSPAGTVDAYDTGSQVLGNDGVSYVALTTVGGGPNPVDSGIVTPGYRTFFPTVIHTLAWPWASSGYQSGDTQAVDIGHIEVGFTTKLAVVLLAPLVSTVSSITLYACAGTDNQGASVGTFTPQAPTTRGVTLLPPTAGFEQFDYFIGEGTQEWYDGNPVSFQFTLPPNNFRLIFGSATSSAVLTPTASASDLSAALNDVVSRDTLFGGGTGVVVDHGLGNFVGYPIGTAARNLGAIGCQGVTMQTWDQVTGRHTTFPLNGTSSAWYGNIYIVPRTSAAQTASQVATAYTTGGNTASATEAGPNAFQVILRSSTNPNPRVIGLTPRSPWRVVATFADGSTGDSYNPGPVCTVSGRGLAYETNWNVNGNLTTPPPSTGEYGFWVTVSIGGSYGTTNSSVPASGASIANDIYHRPCIAIDTGSGTAIAVTHDAGLTWTTHTGPAGSLPSLCIDQRSNTFILTVNSGGVATTYRNPNSDWASTTGMTTGATVSGAAAATFNEPNNGRHLLMAIVVSGALDIYESFDAATSWALRSTVTTGMATNRGLCASIQWVGSALFIIYSKGTSLFSQRSVDGGSTWQAAVTIATGHTYSFVSAVVQGGQIIVRGVDDSGSSTPWHHWQSSDLAATWTETTNAATPQTKATEPSAIGKWEQSGKLIISGSNLT